MAYQQPNRTDPNAPGYSIFPEKDWAEVERRLREGARARQVGYDETDMEGVRRGYYNSSVNNEFAGPSRPGDLESAIANQMAIYQARASNTPGGGHDDGPTGTVTTPQTSRGGGGEDAAFDPRIAALMAGGRTQGRATGPVMPTLSLTQLMQLAAAGSQVRYPWQY